MVVVIKPTFVQHEDDSPKKRHLSILTAQVSPDGSRLATGGMDQKIKIWSTEPILDQEKEEDEGCNKLLSTLGSHTGNVLCVRWSPDGHYLASGSDDFIVIVWERDDTAYGRKIFGQTTENHEVWKPAKRLVGHESDIGALAWSSDGYYLATGSADRQVLIWDGDNFNLIHRINFHEGMVKGLAFDPAGEFLATQSDDQSVCIWKTKDWSLNTKITEPFVDSPNESWFRRMSWSPEGTFLAVPNCVNNGVFVAGLLQRKNWSQDQSTSLIGHDNVVDVIAFNPISFVNNPNKPHAGGNLCSVLAVAARNCISVWKTAQERPIVVFDTIVDRDTLDLSWSSDGTTLYACSSEGQVAVMEFQLSELGQPAELGARERFLKTWKFERPPRPNGSAGGGGAFGTSNGNNGFGGGSGGTAARPNVLQPRKKGAGAGSGGARGGGNSDALLPIPPPGAPQEITMLGNGKRRIKPTFLGLGGIVPQQMGPSPIMHNATVPSSNINNQQVYQPVASTSRAAPFSVAFGGGDSDTEMLDARMHASTSSRQQRTSLQDVGVPSWGAPQDRPVQHALQSSRKRKAGSLDYILSEDDVPTSLAPYRPPGRTLGGDRPAYAPYSGEMVKIRPAYLPRTRVEIPKEEMELAVPAVKAHVVLKWDHEGEEVEVLEYRNFASTARASEVAQLNGKGKVQWLDYMPSAIVGAAFAPTFSAVSCEDKSLHVYSASGRRIMPTLLLDAPCSFLDAAGNFLLAITAKGTLHVWDTRRRKAVFHPTSVYPLLSPSSSTSSNKSVPPIISSAKVRPNGSPFLSLSNGTVVTYDPDLSSWTELSSTWWSKGSEFWEGRIRSTSANAGRGVVRVLENEANDYMAAANDTSDSAAAMIKEEEEGTGIRDSLEGQEQEKLGNADDWKMALSLGHLESRMAAAVTLDSLPEYRSNLVLYARKLAEEAFRGKAEELIKELMGPIYHRPGREDHTWQPTLLGTPKHTLLREVLNVFGKSKPFSKLASETNETLKRMAADA